MRTYIFTESDSPARGFNVSIRVWRIKQNRPHQVGHSDSHTASWYGAHGEAQRIIHVHDKIPMIRERISGGQHLKNLLGFADMYDTTGGNGIRLFEI
jgi:hypothetical protein